MTTDFLSLEDVLDLHADQVDRVLPASVYESFRGIWYRRRPTHRVVEDEWYNEHRPHTWLGGRTPNEVYYETFPANRRPRFETRERWPRGSPCARPWALVRGSPGAKLTLEVSFQGGRKHLPVVALKRAG